MLQILLDWEYTIKRLNILLCAENEKFWSFSTASWLFSFENVNKHLISCNYSIETRKRWQYIPQIRLHNMQTKNSLQYELLFAQLNISRTNYGIKVSKMTEIHTGLTVSTRNKILYFSIQVVNDNSGLLIRSLFAN